MNIELLLGILIVVCIVGLLSSTLRCNSATKKYADLREQAKKQSERNDEIQQRSKELLDREEALLRRIETIVSKFDSNSGA